MWLRQIPNKVFLYNAAELSVGKADTVAWPIQFALTRHSKEYIVSKGNLPTKAYLSNYLYRWARKVKW